MGQKLREALRRFLTKTGDGLGDPNAIGDQATGGPFYYYWEATQITEIERMLVLIQAPPANFNAERYGNVVALVDGVQILHLDNDGAVADGGATVIEDLTAGQKVKTNAEWGGHCYDDDPNTFGSGDNYVKVRWTFGKAGCPLILYPGERVAVRLNDLFPSLVRHTFKVEGKIPHNATNVFVG